MASPGSIDLAGGMRPNAEPATHAPRQFRYADRISLGTDHETDGDHTIEGVNSGNNENNTSSADPSTRVRIAFENLSRTELQRHASVDIPALFSGTSFTIADDKQDAGRHIDSIKLAEIVSHLVRRRNLNFEQIEAVKHTFKSKTGLTLIRGFPGTGKTTTATAAAYEHCRFGNKVLFTCPSDKAIDATIAAFFKEWTSVESYVKAARAAEAMHTDTQQLNAPTERPIRAVCLSGDWAYLRSTEEADSTVHSEKLAAHDDALIKYFNGKEIDIVFTTCSAASLDTLKGHFKPDVIFVDGAGQTTTADIYRALDSHKKHIRWLILTGDEQELMPVVTTTESTGDMTVSPQNLFSKLIHNPGKRYICDMLREQHRQHPELSAYVNEAFYKGKLHHDPFAMRISPKQRTVKNFFANIGRGWRHSTGVRVAIDITGDGSHCVKYKESSLFCNPKESRIIVEIICRLLTYTPITTRDRKKYNYAAIEPADIAIVTDCTGQLQQIEDDLRARGHNAVQNKLLSAVTVSNTRDIQGSEAGIVFISLCNNNPRGAVHGLRFIADSQVLRIQNSRARWFQVTLGNFSGWCKATAADPGEGINHWRFKEFRKLVYHFYYAGDIVALSDLEATVLASGQPRDLEKSAFYEEFPNLEPTHMRNRERKRLQAIAKQQAVSATAPLSNRALKKARQIADHRRKLFEMAGFDSLMLDEEDEMTIEDEQEK